MSVTHWRFVNKKTGAEIIVHDPISAANLTEALTIHGDLWKGVKGRKKMEPRHDFHESRAKQVETGKVPGAEFNIQELYPEPPPHPKGRPQRRFPRYPYRFRVILSLKDITYRTFTQEVSLGGMKLKQKVPTAFMGKPCKVYIGWSDSSENIEINGAVLMDDPINPLRVKFTDVKAETLQALESWFEQSRLQIEKDLESKKAPESDSKAEHAHSKQEK